MNRKVLWINKLRGEYDRYIYNCKKIDKKLYYNDSIWSISICEDSNPIDTKVYENIKNPVLTEKDVTDVKAQFVADPFIISVCF